MAKREKRRVYDDWDYDYVRDEDVKRAREQQRRESREQKPKYLQYDWTEED